MGDTVFFTNASEDGNSFEWDFGDGNSSMEENPIHIYQDSGKYIIRLKATNSDGSHEYTRNLTVLLAPLWKKYNIVKPIPYPAVMDVEDMDGDGKDDILVTSVNLGEVLWYRNTLPGDWVVNFIDYNLFGPVGVCAADFDGDGDPDVAASAWSGNILVWYTNEGGTSTNWSKHTIDNTRKLGNMVVACDLDADSDIDIAMTWRGSDLVMWYENKLPGDWVENIVGSVGEPEVMDVDDIDGDGDLDIATANVSDNSVVWFANNLPDGGWSKAVIDNNMPEGSGLSIADINGDGHMDVAATAKNATGSEVDVAWFENNGGGQSWTRHDISSEPEIARTLQMDDMDNDGEMDIIVTATGSNQVIVYRNMGKGSSWATYIIDGNFTGANYVLPYDINGDSHIDIIANAKTANQMVWYKNPGTGFKSE